MKDSFLTDKKKIRKRQRLGNGGQKYAIEEIIAEEERTLRKQPWC